MIDSTFVEKIEKLAVENEIQIIKDESGREYFTSKPQPNSPPLAGSLHVSTLDGLVDMIEAEELECSIFIDNPRSVSLRGELDDRWRQRETFAVATIEQNGFPFERALSIEDFIINVQCNFVESEEKQKLLRLVSSITSSEVTTAEDDGLTQEVVTKATIGHKKSQVQIDPIVLLEPYRTFREIAQPADEFLIRMHKRDGDLPSVSLRSAGGDTWKHEAIQSIYEYLKAKAPEGVAVIR